MNAEKQNLERLQAAYERGNFLVLDTETTGLERGEIVQIAVIDPDGKPLLYSYVKPAFDIPHDATRVHGITDAHVMGAPSWAQISAALLDIVRGRELVIYNAVYDRKMMHQSAERAGIPKTDWKTVAPNHCAMLAYAEFIGAWNDYRGSYRWHKLTDAALACDVPVAAAHDALGDCMMTLGVIRFMCGVNGNG